MSDSSQPAQPLIATRSVGEGLDFACNLLSTALGPVADEQPDRASVFLHLIADYISFRYNGEDELALKCLDQLGEQLAGSELVRWNQFRAQLTWLGQRLGTQVLRQKEPGATG